MGKVQPVSVGRWRARIESDLAGMRKTVEEVTVYPREEGDKKRAAGLNVCLVTLESHGTVLWQVKRLQ